MNPDLNDIFTDDWPEDHRSGVVAIVGRPNVGKSTLMNHILGQKVAIVTNKPQTTRKQQIGIYTIEKAQVLFTDTPGLHKPHNKLGDYMIYVAEQAIKDADVILWVLDATTAPQTGEQAIAQTLKTIKPAETPVVLALNKVDMLTPEADLSEHLALVDHQAALRISALHGNGVDALLAHLVGLLPLGPRYYPADQVSEVNLRFIAAEVIREKIIENTEQEIPYSVAVAIDEYKERSEDMTYISATIYVERDSQKGIIVGKGGHMIRRIGQEARTELEHSVGTRVFLDLHVKVLKNWRSKEPLLRRLGYRDR